jgi:hypothetical protein
VREYQERLYHALAWSENRKKIYILLKQLELMKKDETKRNKVDHGERLLLYPYPIFLVLKVVPTMHGRVNT